MRGGMGASCPDAFAVLDASTVGRTLWGDLPAVIAAVHEAYLRHGEGSTLNPATDGLHFPNRHGARILALPAHINGASQISGIKWIASFPENLKRGLPRASAVVVLNDEETGRPFVCLEGSQISAARTAASAVIAAAAMNDGQRVVSKLAVCGAGLISRYTWRFLLSDKWRFESVAVFDQDRGRGEAFAAELGAVPVRICASVREAALNSEMVLFATTATRPHVDLLALPPEPRVVLHLSLRDLAPEVIAEAQNIVDDVAHAFRDGTSLALARQADPTRPHMTGSLYELLKSSIELDQNRPRIFSPFGLGILDLAVARLVMERAIESDLVDWIPEFFTSNHSSRRVDETLKEVQ